MWRDARSGYVFRMWMGGRVLLKSDSITELSKALSKFQAEVKNPANSAVNPFFKSKYAPLNEILNDVRPILSKHGLSVIQAPSSEDGERITITTMLLHNSGEWIQCDALTLKAEKMTPQGAGVCTTYGRRYAISALLGISSEDDDDGNGAEAKKPAPIAAKPAPKAAITPQVAKEIENTISKAIGEPPKPKPIDKVKWWMQVHSLGLTDAEVHDIAGQESIADILADRTLATELYGKCKIVADERKGA
jgi:hypothetical protein